MRLASFALAVPFVLLAACGGPQTSQSNNGQANISNDARPEGTAMATNAANGMVMLAAAPTKDQLLKIMHDRHEGMETIGKQTKAIARELGASSPDLGVVRPAAAKIAELSRQASDWFPKGTGTELGKTGAKPEIWQDPKDFDTKLRGFQAAAAAFNAAAATSDVNAIKARFATLGGACKACHDKYRAEMHH